MKRTNDPISFMFYEKGMTLIEVVISMAIFSIGFLAIAGLVVATTRNNTTGNMLTEASMLARARMEYLKALPLDQLANACPDHGLPELVGRVYVRECRISPITPIDALEPSATIKTVKVTVKWKKTGQVRQVVLQTNTRGRGK
jgi:prepilin-type N-terminal cleavage/methylation domain-containing protein